MVESGYRFGLYWGTPNPVRGSVGTGSFVEGSENAREVSIRFVRVLKSRSGQRTTLTVTVECIFILWRHPRPDYP